MKRFFFTAAIFFIGFLLSADSRTKEIYFTALIGEDNYTKLLKEGEVTSVYDRDRGPILFPVVPPEAGAILSPQTNPVVQVVEEVDPVIGVEVLYLLKREGTPQESGEARLHIFNTLHKVSSLKGIEYFSDSRKRMRIFFKEAYVISAPTGGLRLSDPVASAPAPFDQVYAFLDDSTFGKYAAEIRFETAPAFFAMNIQNAVPVKYLLATAVEPGNLRFLIRLYPCEDYILFYGFTCVNSINLFGIVEKKIPSFFNRLKAMYEWFEGQL